MVVCFVADDDFVRGFSGETTSSASSGLEEGSCSCDEAAALFLKICNGAGFEGGWCVSSLPVGLIRSRISSCPVCTPSSAHPYPPDACCVVDSSFALSLEQPFHAVSYRCKSIDLISVAVIREVPLFV